MSFAGPQERKNFLLILLGAFLSKLGDAFSLLAITLHLLDLSPSQYWLSAYMLSRYLPSVLIGFVAIECMSSANRRTRLVESYILSGISCLMICLNIYSIPWILFFSAFHGLIQAFSSAQQKAYLVQVLPPHQAMRWNGFLLTSETLAKLFGFILAGSAFFNGHLQYALILDSLSFLLIAVCTAMTSPHSMNLLLLEKSYFRKSPDRPNIRNFHGSYSWFFGDSRRFLPSLLFSAPWLATGTLFALEASYAKHTFHATSEAIGLLYALANFGSLLGAAALLKLEPSHSGRALTLTCIGEVLFVLGYSLSQNLRVASLFVLLYGSALAVRTTLTNTYLHQSQPSSLHGTAFSCHQGVSNSLVLLGLLLAGPLSESFSIRTALITAEVGALLLIATVLAYQRKFLNKDWTRRVVKKLLGFCF